MIQRETIPSGLKNRSLLTSLKKSLDQEEILLLIGSRQAGKSSLLYLLVDYLLHTAKIPASQIFFFDLELISQVEFLDSLKNFDDFLAFLKNQGANFSQKVFVLIDEIQYLTHPSSFLKYLHDHYKSKIKFIVSGSSTLEMKKKFTDRLTGRMERFTVHPLSFTEYLVFKEEKNLLKKRSNFNLFKLIKQPTIKEIKSSCRFLEKDFLANFQEYVLFGGYPKVVLKETQEEKIKSLAEIYSLYVRKDIKDLANIADIKGFNSLVSLLGWQTGSLINETELASSSSLSRPTVRKYLFLLENTFITHLILPFFTNPRREFVKMPKLYFEDAGLRNAIINDFRSLEKRQDAGLLFENAVFLQVLQNLPFLWEIHFWRNARGLESDFILLGEQKKPIPVEVKYQKFKKATVSSGLVSFIKRYSPELGLIITQDFFAARKLNKTTVLFLPAWLV